MTTEQNADSNSFDLKTARENSGLTLKEMFERTRISALNLEAIENGDFHLLPVPIYARNFIKTYADALGVDSEPVLQRYEQYLQALKMKEKEKAPEQNTGAPLAVILANYKAYIWAACIIIVFVAVSFFVSVHNKPSPQALQKQENSQKTATQQSPVLNTAIPETFPVAIDLPKPGQPPTNKPSGDAPRQPNEKSAATPGASATRQAEALTNSDEETDYDEEPSVLTIYASEETWLRIKADSKESFQVLLQPGEKISQKAARFNIDIGNAGGIRLDFDGKVIDNLGKTGQVIHLRLP